MIKFPIWLSVQEWSSVQVRPNAHHIKVDTVERAFSLAHYNATWLTNVFVTISTHATYIRRYRNLWQRLHQLSSLLSPHFEPPAMRFLIKLWVFVDIHWPRSVCGIRFVFILGFSVVFPPRFSLSLDSTQTRLTNVTKLIGNLTFNDFWIH